MSKKKLRCQTDWDKYGFWRDQSFPHLPKAKAHSNHILLHIEYTNMIKWLLVISNCRLHEWWSPF